MKNFIKILSILILSIFIFNIWSVNANYLSKEKRERIDIILSNKEKTINKEIEDDKKYLEMYKKWEVGIDFAYFWSILKIDTYVYKIYEKIKTNNYNDSFWIILKDKKYSKIVSILDKKWKSLSLLDSNDIYKVLKSNRREVVKEIYILLYMKQNSFLSK